MYVVYMVYIDVCTWARLRLEAPEPPSKRARTNGHGHKGGHGGGHEGGHDDGHGHGHGASRHDSGVSTCSRSEPEDLEMDVEI